MKKALLVIYISPNFSELIRVARLLKQSPGYECVLYFTWHYPYVERDVAIAQTEGILCLGPDGQAVNLTRLGGVEAAVGSGPPKRQWRPKRPDFRPFLRHVLPQRVRTLLSRTFWAVLESVLALYDACFRYYRYQNRLAHRIIRQERPDIMVFAEDNVEYRSPIWIKVGHEYGIPSVIVPFTVANATEPAEAYLNSPDRSLNRWSNRLIARRYPHWVYEHKGHRMVRMPAAKILVTEWFGFAPPMPWVLHSGYADAITVENEAMRDHYLREGFPEAQLVSTGALYDDVLAERLQNHVEHREALYKELGLPPGRPMLLVALPPDQTPLRQQECDFSSYADLVAFWLDTLAACNDRHNVVINLHPRLDYESMCYIEQWGVKIARQSIAELTPLCDIFVASVSATIRLAIACGKPVINYDVFRYGYADYAQAGGVLTFEEQHEFVEAVQRLTTDPDFYAQVKARQEQIMHRWGMLDGKSGERMLRLFDRLIAEAQTEKAPADRGPTR